MRKQKIILIAVAAVLLIVGIGAYLFYGRYNQCNQFSGQDNYNSSYKAYQCREAGCRVKIIKDLPGPPNSYDMNGYIMECKPF